MSTKPMSKKPTKTDAGKDVAAPAASAVDFAEIRRRREALTLSMDEAGQAAGQAPGRARQWWNDVESARRPDLRISTMIAVARALRCDVEDLILPDARPRASRRR